MTGSRDSCPLPSLLLKILWVTVPPTPQLSTHRHLPVHPIVANSPSRLEV